MVPEMLSSGGAPWCGANAAKLRQRRGLIALTTAKATRQQVGPWYLLEHSATTERDSARYLGCLQVETRVRAPVHRFPRPTVFMVVLPFGACSKSKHADLRADTNQSTVNSTYDGMMADAYAARLASKHS